MGTQATLIEYNLGQVDQALMAVNVALAQGMDWHQLGQMVKAERRAGNPVCGNQLIPELGCKRIRKAAAQLTEWSYCV